MLVYLDTCIVISFFAAETPAFRRGFFPLGEYEVRPSLRST